VSTDPFAQLTPPKRNFAHTDKAYVVGVPAVEGLGEAGKPRRVCLERLEVALDGAVREPGIRLGDGHLMAGGVHGLDRGPCHVPGRRVVARVHVERAEREHVIRAEDGAVEQQPDRRGGDEGACRPAAAGKAIDRLLRGSVISRHCDNI
jgi:hypothetical protein